MFGPIKEQSDDRQVLLVSKDVRREIKEALTHLSQVMDLVEQQYGGPNGRR